MQKPLIGRGPGVIFAYANLVLMDLCIDAGNSSWKLAFFQENVPEDARTLLPPVASGLVPLLEKKRPRMTMVGTVVKMQADLLEHLREKTEGRVLFLDHTLELPFKMGYETPETLGPDRLANAAGAVHQFPGKDVLAIDLGTCITYDLVTEGVYRGGAISPGLDMRARSMHNDTEGLPLVRSITEGLAVGKETEGSLRAGLFHGVLFEIRGFIEAYEKESSHLHVVLTGGAAPLFEKAFKRSIFVDSLLTLRGLNAVLQKNAR